MSPREQLSRKEIQVATMVWEGKTNPEIAAVLGCTEQVIKNQLRGVFDKLGVWSRLELALYIASNGGENWAEHRSDHRSDHAVETIAVPLAKRQTA
jgi:DNA-binding NarL/FixJ family response regulator